MGDSQAQRGLMKKAAIIITTKQAREKINASFFFISLLGICLSLVLGFRASISASITRFMALAPVLALKRVISIRMIFKAEIILPPVAISKETRAKEKEKIVCLNITKVP
jgi:hypothetical protein